MDITVTISQKHVGTEIAYLSAEEACEVFDYQARKLMNMSGEEFLRRWDAGEYRDSFDAPGHESLTSLVMMMSLARQNA